MAAEELADLERLDAKLKAMKSELSRGPGLKLTLDGHPRMRPRRCRADHPSQSPLYIPRSPHRSPGAPRLARRRGPPPRARPPHQSAGIQAGCCTFVQYGSAQHTEHLPSVDLAAMPCVQNQHDELALVDGVQHPVVSHPDT